MSRRMCNTGIKVAGNKIKGKEFQIPIYSFRSFPRGLKSEIEPPTQVTDLPSGSRLLQRSEKSGFGVTRCTSPQHHLLYPHPRESNLNLSEAVYSSHLI